MASKRKEHESQRSLEQEHNGGREQRGLARREWAAPGWPTSPFGFMRRFSEDMDRLFEEFMGHGFLSPSTRQFGQSAWSPQIEVVEHDNELVVRADLPGMKKEDVEVEFSDGSLIIQGERRQEQEETRGGFRQTERYYGRFLRTVPLPEGVDPEDCKATFQNGVLEITLKLPEEAQHRGRRIEIEESASSSASGGQSSGAEAHS